MREIIIKKALSKTVLLQYEDIDQMPIDVYQKINKYWMLSDEVGSSFADIDNKHLQKIMLVAGDKNKTIDAIKKMRQLIYNIANETDFESLAFICSLYSIDSKEITDRSEDSLKHIQTVLSQKGLTNELIKKKTSKTIFGKIWKRIFRPCLVIRAA